MLPETAEDSQTLSLPGYTAIDHIVALKYARYTALEVCPGGQKWLAEIIERDCSTSIWALGSKLLLEKLSLLLDEVNQKVLKVIIAACHLLFHGQLQVFFSSFVHSSRHSSLSSNLSGRSWQ